MLFIVRMQSGMVLSQNLTWVDIKTLNKEDYGTLLVLPGKTEKAQNLCKWFVSDGHTVNPVTAKKIKEKWNVDLSVLNAETFTKGLQTKQLPECLKRVPVGKDQIQEFQRMWVKECRPSAPDSSVPTANPAPAKPAVVCKLAAPLHHSSQLSDQPAKTLNLQPTAISVMERSSLIVEMLDTVSAFGKLMQEIPAMLKERQEELKVVEQKLLDLRHIAELGNNLNAAEGYLFYKEQRKALRQRRTLKDEVLALESAATLIKGAITATEVTRFVNRLNGLDDRQYQPRAIQESEVAEIIQNPKNLDLILGKCPSAQVD